MNKKQRTRKLEQRQRHAQRSSGETDLDSGEPPEPEQSRTASAQAANTPQPQAPQPMLAPLAEEDFRRFLPMSSREVRAELAREVAKLKRQVSDLLAPFDSLHLIASAVVQFGFTTAAYREATQEPLTTIEYLASLLLERPDRVRNDPLKESSVFYAATINARAYIRRIGLLSGVACYAVPKGDDPWLRLEGAARGHRQQSRCPGYHDVAEKLIRTVTAPVADDIKRVLGFSPAEALRLIASIEEQTTSAVRAQRDEAVDIVEDAQSRGMLPPFSPDGRQFGEAEQVCYAYTFLVKKLVHGLALTADRLAQSADMDLETTQSLLDAFTTPFGSVRGVHFFAAEPDIMRRPFVKRDDDYLLTSSANLLWALRPAFEKALENDAAGARYLAHRAAAVEQWAADALKSAFGPSTQAWTNLKFDIDGAGGYEVDVLIRCDHLCIIGEAKSGMVRPGHLRRDLKATVGKASRQTQRLRDALAGGQDVEFYENTGGDRVSVRVDLADVSRFDAVVVTLDDAMFLNGREAELRAAGVIAQNGYMPWVVSLWDLTEICNLIEHPAQLSLYMKKRRCIDDTLNGMFDELDLFMCHLRYSLNMSTPEGMTGNLDTTFTHELDQYRFLGAGPKPRKDLPEMTEQALAALEDERKPGFLAEAEELIAEVQLRRRPPAHRVDPRTTLARIVGREAGGRNAPAGAAIMRAPLKLKPL